MRHVRLRRTLAEHRVPMGLVELARTMAGQPHDVPATTVSSASHSYSRSRPVADPCGQLQRARGVSHFTSKTAASKHSPDRTKRCVMTRPTVLVLLRYYLPGYKAGGPLRTIANMADQLGDELDFKIITSDRDLGDDRPFSNVKVDRWNDVGGSRVFYASPRMQSLFGLASVIRATLHDVLYLNSYFDPVFSARPLVARRLRSFQSRPSVLAPRGEFSEGALSLKAPKKVAYRTLSRVAGFHRQLTWQASSEHESADIQRFIGVRMDEIVVAPDLPARPTLALPNGEVTRRKGDPLRICFISRISPKKNLDFALQILARVRCPVVFDIYGPREDGAYWAGCQTVMRELPERVSARYQGTLEHGRVDEAFRAHDLFLFPTRGENFGHVILESMRAGTPVLIADTTPWRGLEAVGVGWDLPLKDTDAFVLAIEKAYTVDGPKYRAWRERVHDYANRRSADPAVSEANRRLFLDVIGSS